MIKDIGKKAKGKQSYGKTKGAGTDDYGGGSPSDGDKKPTVRSTKKRHLPATGRKPPGGHRIKRQRITDPLPTNGEDFEGGYALKGKKRAERKMTPRLGFRRGRPRKQFLVQSWRECRASTAGRLEKQTGRRRGRRAEAYSAGPLESVHQHSSQALACGNSQRPTIV